ncbi:hypothetical protein [Catenuloplanes indicus]|uniref:Uncharacterized protein n=1 Tax=Catenuloplanes indicus TaxID=137267 RepID=A0AAE3W8U1_9ACTN|nr:hypothetical protein [Catenuloplanes indicus]MDQ0371390.1 hypothetical protein [Catenuloplanes indicus]
MPVDPVTEAPACDVCGGTPAEFATFRSVLALLIAWQLQTRRGWFCRDCGVSVHREMTTFTMVAGWWGLAFLGALTAIAMNASAAGRLARLPAPAYRTGRPLAPRRPLSRSPALIGPILFGTLVLAFCCGVPGR